MKEDIRKNSYAAGYEEFRLVANRGKHRLIWHISVTLVLFAIVLIGLVGLGLSSKVVPYREVTIAKASQNVPNRYQMAERERGGNPTIQTVSIQSEWKVEATSNVPTNVPDNVIDIDMREVRLALEELEKPAIMDANNVIKSRAQEPAEEDYDMSDFVELDYMNLPKSEIYIIDGISSESGKGRMPVGISPYGPGDEYVYHVNDREKIKMARILYLECRGQPIEGQVAVAAVILNRMAMGYHGNNTARRVMMEFGTHEYVDGVSRADLQKHPNCMLAVELALRGWDPTRILFPEHGAIYFYAPDDTCKSELKKREGVAKVVIGDHTFHNEILKNPLSEEEMIELEGSITNFGNFEDPDFVSSIQPEDEAIVILDDIEEE